MLEINQYFNGRVKSIRFENQHGKFTCGVMMQGEYEFSTQSREVMTVISGQMKVKIKEQDDWKTYQSFESFTIEPNNNFRVIITDTACAYLCKYE